MPPVKFTSAVATILLVSGGLHLALWMASGQAWEGPVSLRKPALFGISGGVTAWSLGWVIICLTKIKRWEHWASLTASLALLVEVGLITVQFWRGVPSHFNRATRLDTGIELAMLTLILGVTLWIAWLCFRVLQPMKSAPTMSLAIRAGMWWLLLSCVLGIGTTMLGVWNLSQGRPYHLWGTAGVLKFPHGIALHAIQFLPLCAVLLERWRIKNAYRVMWGLNAAQLFLVAYALWQTGNGRSREAADLWGGLLLLLAVASALIPLSFSYWSQEQKAAAG